MTTTGKIENLPQWARNEIINLRTKIVSLKADLQAAVCKSETKTYVVSYDIAKKAHIFLPDDGQVRFEFEAGYIEAYRKEGCLAVRSMGSPTSGLRIYPLVSNVILVDLGETP